MPPLFVAFILKCSLRKIDETAYNGILKIPFLRQGFPEKNPINIIGLLGLSLPYFIRSSKITPLIHPLCIYDVIQITIENVQNIGVKILVYTHNTGFISA